MTSNNFGTVEFSGIEYTLTSDAGLTSRFLEFNNNHTDVQDGEEFDFEMSANAVDNKGNEYIVYWIFTDVKGKNEKESLDMFDYDVVNRVERA